MAKTIFYLCLTSICLTGYCLAEQVIWEGEVNSDGTPTTSVKLTLGHEYFIKVSGVMNLKKWWKQGKPLEEDACFEFNAEQTPMKLLSFKNSININVCDGTYHPDHIYTSKPFIAAQSGVHFWIYDSDYEDNNGTLFVQVIDTERKKL